MKRSVAFSVVIALALLWPAAGLTAGEAPSNAKPTPGSNFTPAEPPLFPQAICISDDGDECRCGQGKICSAGPNGCACLPVG